MSLTPEEFGRLKPWRATKKQRADIGAVAFATVDSPDPPKPRQSKFSLSDEFNWGPIEWLIVFVILFTIVYDFL